MKLNRKTCEKIDGKLKDAAEEYCNFAMTRASMDAIFGKEAELYNAHTEDISKSAQALTDGFAEQMKGNALYERTYRNEPEKKKDAQRALLFGRGAATLKAGIGTYTAQYALVSMGRMELEKKRTRLADEKFQEKKAQIAADAAKAGKAKLFLLLPVALAVLFFFVPLLLRPVTSTAFDEFFYLGPTPNIIWICLLIAFLGLVIAGIALAIRSNLKRAAAMRYIEESPALKEAKQKEAELDALYKEKAEKAKAASDSYFELMNTVVAYINEQCLSIFPAEFANAADLGDGEQLLGAGRAETMKEVYDILERRHADNTRAQAEAAHRAKMESMSLERLESQKKAEEYARKQAEYARTQAEYARTQAEYAKEQADSMKRIAQESEKQTAYARAQADNAERIQADIDTIKRS